MEKYIERVKQTREALQADEGFSSPSHISENMYKLAQYNSALEEYLGDLEEELGQKESEYFLKLIEEGKSANAAKVSMTYKFAKERAHITKITRLVSSSWRLVNASQSRINNLIAESKNQI